MQTGKIALGHALIIIMLAGCLMLEATSTVIMLLTDIRYIYTILFFAKNYNFPFDIAN